MPDRHADVDGVPHAAEVRGQRDPRRPQLGVEHGDLEGLLGHAVALDRLQDVGHRRAGEGVTGGEQHRDQVVHQRQTGAVVELRGVVGVDIGRALAPAHAEIGLGAHDQHVPNGLLAEAGAERPDQREADTVEDDGKEAHRRIIAPATPGHHLRRPGQAPPGGRQASRQAMARMAAPSRMSSDTNVFCSRSKSEGDTSR